MTSRSRAVMEPVPPVGPGFFPLDEELALLPGRLAPSLQEHLTHVASWMPFGRATQMLIRLLGVQMSKATIRRHPLAWGALYEQQQSAESKQPLAPANEPSASSAVHRLVFSGEGASVGLIKGAWAEVRTLVMGEVEPSSSPEREVQTQALSSFSRMTDAATFKDLAEVEMRRRGVVQAEHVCAVTDGADWRHPLPRCASGGCLAHPRCSACCTALWPDRRSVRPQRPTFASRVGGAAVPRPQASGARGVRKIMETALVTVSPDTLVVAVVHLLLETPFRTVPVVDEQHHLLGIIGTRDLVNAGVLPLRRGVVRTALELEDLPIELLASSLAPVQRKDATAREVMNRQVHTLDPDSSVRQATQRMVETGLHCLPVVSAEGTLLGMFTRADLFQLVVTTPLMESEASSATHPLGPSRPLIPLPMQQQQIGTFPLLEAPTVEEHTPLAEVIDALVLSPLKRVFVVDAAQHVLGVISDVDVLARLTEEERPAWLRFLAQWTRGDHPQRLSTGALRQPAGKVRDATDLMNRGVVTITETMTVQETVERMMQTHRKVLPVIEEHHRLKGVVGRAEVLRILLEGE